jgi:hypothetical protein
MNTRQAYDEALDLLPTLSFDEGMELSRKLGVMASELGFSRERLQEDIALSREIHREQRDHGHLWTTK